MYEDGFAFGTSCHKHGLDWRKARRAISLQIMQDPADTTPAHSGRLCFVCNSENPSDHTARHANDLWAAAVVRGDNAERASRYLSAHYWTNALMHGDSSASRMLHIRAARQCCGSVLRDQIESLRPKIIVACGKVAVTSLMELRFLRRSWDDFRTHLRDGVYSEQSALNSGEPVKVFCTYHTAARVVNQTVAAFYSTSMVTNLKRMGGNPKDHQALDQFLSRYSVAANKEKSSEGRGMRVLLLHWREIGDAIRMAHSAPRSYT